VNIIEIKLKITCQTSKKKVQGSFGVQVDCLQYIHSKLGEEHAVKKLFLAIFFFCFQKVFEFVNQPVLKYEVQQIIFISKGIIN
jgi:hypothetical protein